MITPIQPISLGSNSLNETVRIGMVRRRVDETTTGLRNLTITARDCIDRLPKTILALTLTYLPFKEWFLAKSINRSFRNLPLKMIFNANNFKANQGGNLCLEYLPIDKREQIVIELANQILSLRIFSTDSLKLSVPCPYLTHLDIRLSEDENPEEFEKALCEFASKIPRLYPKLESLRFNAVQIHSIQCLHQLLTHVPTITHLDLCTQHMDHLKAEENQRVWVEAINLLPKLQTWNLTTMYGDNLNGVITWDWIPAESSFFAKMNSLTIKEHEDATGLPLSKQCLAMIEKCIALNGFHLVGNYYEMSSRSASLRDRLTKSSLHDLTLVIKNSCRRFVNPLPCNARKVFLCVEDKIQLGQLSHYPDLTSLCLSAKASIFNDELLADIAQAPALKHLMCIHRDFYGSEESETILTSITNAGLITLSRCHALESLVIAEGMFTIEGIEKLLLNCKKLREIIILRDHPETPSISDDDMLRLRREKFPDLLFRQIDVLSSEEFLGISCSDNFGILKSYLTQTGFDPMTLPFGTNLPIWVRALCCNDNEGNIDF